MYLCGIINMAVVLINVFISTLQYSWQESSDTSSVVGRTFIEKFKYNSAETCKVNKHLYVDLWLTKLIFAYILI